MGAFGEISLKLYRFALVLPPAASWQRIVDRLLGRDRRRDWVPPPLVHPIDGAYGIDTSGTVGFEQLRTGRRSDLYNVSYGGSQPSIIRKALSMIPDLDRSTFLDFGCGKGRALAVASEFPFRRILGVELVPALARVAQANAAEIARRFPERTPIEVIEGDVLEAALPAGQVVIFYYHPFFKALMKKVVAKIEAALKAGATTKVFVVYYNPVYGDLYDRSALFCRYFADDVAFAEEERGTGASYEDQSDALVIWQSLGQPMAPAQNGATGRIRVLPPGWRSTVEPS